MEEEKCEQAHSLDESPQRRSSPRRGTKRLAPHAITPKRARSRSSKSSDPAEVTPLTKGPLTKGVDVGASETASNLGKRRASTPRTESTFSSNTASESLFGADDDDESDVMEDDQLHIIPLFEEVWPVLEKLQFVREGPSSTYRLPEHVGYTGSFESPEALQRYLCSCGVPLLPGMEEVETKESCIEFVLKSQSEEKAGEESKTVRIVQKEFLRLSRWVRYSILLPLLENSRSIPKFEVLIDERQAKEDLKQIGLMNEQSKYIIPETDGTISETTFTNLQLQIAREGLPPQILEKEGYRDPALRLLLFVVEYPKLETFIFSPVKPTAARPSPEKPKRPSRPAKQVSNIELPDNDLPPMKRVGKYTRSKSVVRRDTKIKDPERTLTRTVLLDGSPVRHIWHVMSWRPHLGRRHTLRADQFAWPYNKSFFVDGQSGRSYDESFSEGYLGFRHEIGRIYYNSFRIKGVTLKVGDFVKLEMKDDEEEEIARILSAFEATKSWTALQNYGAKAQAEYQKRGHGYIEIAPLVRVFVKGKTRWKLMKKSVDQPGHVDARPRWLFEPSLEIQKLDITVRTNQDTDRGTSIVADGKDGICVYSDQDQFLLLTEDAETLCEHRIGYPWPSDWKAQQVHIVSREVGRNATCGGVSLSRDLVNNSSDDSDGALQTDCLKNLADRQKRRVTARKTVHERPLPAVLLVGSMEPDADSSKDVIEKFYSDTGTPEAVRRVLAPHCRARALLSIETQPDPNADPSDMLEEAQKLIGSNGSFRGLQGQVIHAAVQTASPVIYLAPCGHGKTMTFLVPALKEGGITVVIEPLKELMRNHIEQLKRLDNGRGLFDVEQLVSKDDARESGMHPAETRLCQLLESCNVTEGPVRPRVLFTSPEILKIYTDQFKALQPFLTRIVCDEFDAAVESGRDAYDSLPSYLFKHFPTEKVMFLSGTATREESFGDFISDESLTPVVFMEPTIISPALCFSVERRKDFGQVASRIDQMLQNYEAKHPGERPKALVYCTQKNYCDSMVEQLKKLKRKAAKVTGEKSQSQETKATVMRAFEDNRVQIVACTTALGRGVHVKNIRFVFHAWCPMSLGSYIQEAGRAGRDGIESYCTLFYKPGDLSTVKTLRTNPGQTTDKNLVGDLSDLAKYCVQGHECRSRYLSRHAVRPFASHLNRINDCGKCDVCQAKKEREGPYQNRESIKFLIMQYLERPLDGRGNVSWRSLMEEARGSKSISDRTYSSLAEFGQGDGSLCEDILGLLSWLGVLSYDRYTAGQRLDSFDAFKSRIENGQVDVILQWPDDDTWGMEEVPDLSPHAASSQLKPGAKALDVQMADPPDPHQEKDAGHSVGDCLLLDMEQQRHYNEIEKLLPSGAFLLRFEMTRLLARKHEPDMMKLQNHSWRMESLDGQYEDWTFLHETFRAACDAGCESDIRSILGSNLPIKNLDQALYFNAKYNVLSNKIDLLLPPRRAFDRLIFRRFGTDRFLHVDVEASSKDCSKEAVCDTLSREISIAGREFKLLWCKQTKNPQCYVLFAETGKGIGRNDEIKVDNVWQWAIPPDFNKGLTTEKAWKRMKLLFSKTTSAGVLPSGSIEIVDDIEVDGINRTDGCGLASTEAFDFMWRHYQKAIDPEQEEDNFCPYSSVQVRIGGFKGLLVLDKSLDGFKIMCRKSMKKFNLPMQSLEGQDFSDGIDDAYDTVCVCNWANRKPETAHLNIRVIQQLAALAERERNLDAFVDLLFKCVDNGIREVVKLQELWSNLRTRQAGMKQERGGDERSTLFHMENAGVAQDEPVRRQLFLKIQREEVKAMREKAKYPLPSTSYLWMIPDHTGLLEEGEAYVAVHDPSIRKGATHCLAMRSPSYFIGDMRKLKLVDDDMLEERSRNHLDGRNKLKFFRGLEIGLVLSTKGQLCEADAMSGGDYDGDKAWVCWHPELVNLVSRVEPEDRSSDRFQKKESPENATKPFYQTKLRERVEYAMHFRHHQSQLGRLSNDLDRIIDMYGFGDPEGIATEYGAQAFLQVDHPYFLCEVASEIEEKVDKHGWPHWHARATGDATTYPSKKALGLIFDRVEEFLNISREEISTQPKPDSRILDYICKYEGVSDIVSNMRAALREEIDKWDTKRWRWEENEYVKKRSELEDLSTTIGGPDREKLFAAVLYDEASKQVPSNLMLVRQVWFLFGPYLTQIINPTAFALNADGQKRILDGRRGNI